MLSIRTILRSMRLSRSIGEQLGAFGVDRPKVTVRYNGDADAFSDALIRRSRAGQFRVSLSPLDTKRHAVFARHRLPCVLFCLSRCPEDVTGLTIDYSDGDRNSNADFCWSARDPARKLLPDPHFLNARGYDGMRKLATERAIDWDHRSDIIRWRGGPNGAGTMATDLGARFDPAVRQRLRLCMIASQLDGVDARIVSAWNEADPFHGDGGNLTGARIDEPNWLGDKYAIDIDGHSNSWSNFLIRLHFGCCVLKVDSQFGYRQWYYDRIRPWEHYIPVQADMGDLAEKVDWAKSNRAKAKAIARNGQDFARSMTFESETSYAVKTIVQASAGNNECGA